MQHLSGSIAHLRKTETFTAGLWLHLKCSWANDYQQLFEALKAIGCICSQKLGCNLWGWQGESHPRLEGPGWPSFTVPVSFRFSVPLGKTYPEWSCTVQTTGLQIFPGKSPKERQTAWAFIETGKPRKDAQQRMNQAKESEEGDCLNKTPLNIHNTQKILFHWKAFASVYHTGKARDRAFME